MKITQTLKKVIKPHVDAPSWVDLNFLSNSITGVVDLTKRLVTPEKATYQETFEEAIERLNLTEADLKKRVKQFQRLIFLFTLLFCFALAYLLFLLSESKISAALICFSVAILSSSQIFRYHFWMFQIKQRKLGCTFKDWYQQFWKSP